MLQSVNLVMAAISSGDLEGFNNERIDPGPSPDQPLLGIVPSSSDSELLRWEKRSLSSSPQLESSSSWKTHLGSIQSIYGRLLMLLLFQFPFSPLSEPSVAIPRVLIWVFFFFLGFDFHFGSNGLGSCTKRSRKERFEMLLRAPTKLLRALTF